MDPATLSAVAATLVATRFTEGAASEAGKSAWLRIQSVAHAVRERLGRSDTQRASLAALEASPGDEDTRSVVAAHVRHEVENDPQFAATLESLVTAAQREPAAQTLIAHASGNAKQVNISGNNSGSISLS